MACLDALATSRRPSQQPTFCRFLIKSEKLDKTSIFTEKNRSVRHIKGFLAN